MIIMKNFRNCEFNCKIATMMLLLLIGCIFLIPICIVQAYIQLLSLVLLLVIITVYVFIANKNLIHHLARPIAVFLLKTFFNIEVIGANNIPKNGKVILSGNHTGLLDSLIISVACKRPVNFIMTNEVFSWGIAGIIVRLFNIIPVVPKKGNEAINKAVEEINEGKVVCIFPEGRCTKDGSMNRFHLGVARLQSKTKAPLIPFAIEGGFEAWPIGGVPKPYKITVKVGDPIKCDGLKEKDVLEKLKNKIQTIKESLEVASKAHSGDALSGRVIKLFQKTVDDNAYSTAIVQKDGNDWSGMSYHELSNKAKVLANQFINLGVERGEKIAILSESRSEWAVAFFASIRAGATVVPLDIKLTKAELNSILSDCKPSILLVSNEYSDKAVYLKEAISSLKSCFVMEEVSNNSDIPSVSSMNISRFDNSRERMLDETALIIYTSGTTGNPKGVMISFENIFAQMIDINSLFQIKSEDTFLSILPLNHLFELTCGFTFALYSGAKIAYATKLYPKEIAKNMFEQQATYMIAVPLFLTMLKKNIEKEINSSNQLTKKYFWNTYNLAKYIPFQKLRRLMFWPVHKKFGGKLNGFISGGAPLNIEIEEFFERIGLNIFQGYGLTETSPVVAVNSPKHHRKGSVGKVMPSVSVKIASDGEILVRGQSVMQGYFGRPDLTAEVIDEDGWFHTGDIGTFDKDGFLYITGRIKNLIVLGGGKKIHPEEVESLLSKSLLINESCVLGLTAASGIKKDTEQVVAVIVPSENLIKQYNSDVQELQKIIKKEVDILAKDLATYKRPTDIVIKLEELPKTTTRKIKRAAIKEMLEITNIL